MSHIQLNTDWQNIKWRCNNRDSKYKIRYSMKLYHIEACHGVMKKVS